MEMVRSVVLRILWYMLDIALLINALVGWQRHINNQLEIFNRN